MGVRLHWALRSEKQRDLHQSIATVRAKREGIDKRLSHFEYSELPILTLTVVDSREMGVPLRSIGAFHWKKLFKAELRAEPSIGREEAEGYDDWRRKFLHERLHVLYYLGFIANPAFIALDYLQHHEYLYPLFIFRVVLELGLLSGFFLFRYGPKSIPPHWFIMLWVIVANLCVTQMTVILGGF